MKIDEAIKILEKDKAECDPALDPKLNEAYDLSLEALNRIITSRHSKHHNFKRLLPGETE